MKRMTLIKPGYALVKPVLDDTTGFSSEHKKYDRKSIGVVEGVLLDAKTGFSDTIAGCGAKVVFDDSHSVDFRLDGTDYAVVSVDDILGVITEEDK